MLVFRETGGRIANHARIRGQYTFEFIVLLKPSLPSETKRFIKAVEGVEYVNT